MKINIHLTDTSIENAVRQLEDALEQLEGDVGEFVDIMLIEGENVANDAYGSMATAWGQRDNEEREGIVTGHIGVSGENEDVVYIAEFGAGDATLEDTGFENPTPIPVYAGSYSELKGTGEYAENGYWEFPPKSKIYYHEVEPRHGLRNAKAHIIATAGDIAREVILHD